MARDEFSTKTKRLLGEAVGFNCVRPGCGKPTTAYDPVSESMKNISVSAHDAAAAPGGPRYSDHMTTEQRKAADNGAWLCPTCARLVDVDANRFPLGTISNWQQQAAEYRRQRMSMPGAPPGVDFRSASEASQKFIALCNQIQFDLWYNSISPKSMNAIENLLRATLPFIATNLYCAQYPHLVNIQLQMLEAIVLVKREISDSGCWWHDQNFQNFNLVRKCKVYPTNEEQIRNNRIDQSALLVRERFQDFCNLKEELLSIASSPFPPIDLYSW